MAITSNINDDDDGSDDQQDSKQHRHQQQEDSNLNSEFVDISTAAVDDDNDDDDQDYGDESSDSDYLDDEDDDFDDDDDDDGDNDDNVDKKDETTSTATKRIYIPNMTKLSSIDNIEQLECDYSAYILYHKAETGYPCLSFDVCPDEYGDGDERSNKFPLQTLLVAGTQADKDHHNRLLLMKFTNMNPIKNKSDNDDDDDDEEDDDDDEDEILPDLYCVSIPHSGCINRIRCRKIGDKLIVANWSDYGQVNLWDMTNAYNVCNTEDNKRISDFNKQNLNTKPIYSFNGHRKSGFSLDWSPMVDGKLATGDSNKDIFIWNITNDGWIVDQLPLIGHEKSVEDIQWSPNESTILSSCSVDRSIRIWDTRNRRHESALTISDAHESDVNVISWNRKEKAFILSGGDDGIIKVWDLRQIRRGTNNNNNNDNKATSKTTSKPIATFKQHQGPITSIEWNPNDGTVFAASSEDHQITQWDLSVESDDQQQQQQQNDRQSIDNDNSSNKRLKIDNDSNNNKSQQHQMNDDDLINQLPPQLLFIHQGQKEIKEIHWHQQIPGLLISTASTGFDIFRTLSV